MANVIASTWIKPSVLMAADPTLRKLTVGQQISPRSLGWGAHPTFGMIPDFTVETILDDGRLGTAIFVCTEGSCTAEVRVHPGDLFQKRRCKTHQDAVGGSGRNRKLSAEEKLAREVERAKGREVAQLQKANAAFLEAAKKAGASVDQLAQLAAERAALIAKVAAEKGVTISPKAGVEAVQAQA